MAQSGGDRSVNRITTGQLSWDAGVDSSKLTTIASSENPTGIKPNQLTWAVNATMRGGGITQRAGWTFLGTMPHTAVFQEATFYSPDGGFPYMIACIGGRQFRVQVAASFSQFDVDEITIPGDPNPATEPKNWMVQGENFQVIQDGVSLPLIWDGNFMRRSDGPQYVVGVVFTGPSIGPPAQFTFQLFDLNAPFSGTVNQTVLIDNKFWIEVEPDNFAVLQNINDPRNGALLPADVSILDGSGNEVAITLVPLIIPAIGASYNPAFIITAYSGSLPLNVTIDGFDWQITGQGAVPPGANQVRLVNLTATPAAPTIANQTPIYSVPEIPTAQAMAYYMGRLWYASGREFGAGDIVFGPSGTAQYRLRDSILKGTENTYLVGGGSFVTPTNDGEIRALNYTVIQDDTLSGQGQGNLYAFTPSAIYAIHVTPDRASWVTQATPLITLSQRGNGGISDRAIVPVNGDLFYRSPDGIRSLAISLRYQDQWANTPISNEASRALDRDNRALLRYASGVSFDNRCLTTCLPFETDVGVAFKGIVALDFDLISGIASKLPPAWEGMLEGLDVLRVLQANFGGLERCFAFVLGRESQQIELWELTLGERFDNNRTGEARVTWMFETPSFTWGDPFKMKRLESIELWIDRLFGTVDFQVWYRPGSSACWYAWPPGFRECAPKNPCDTIPPSGPCDYPEQDFPEQYRTALVLPTPRASCNSSNGRLTTEDYAFQVRFIITGFCRIRGLRVFATPTVKAPFTGLVCP